MKKFLYMTQTKAALPKAYEVCDNEESDIIYLSWKTPTENSVYYPNYTWTAGRNRLIEEVKKPSTLFKLSLAQRNKPTCDKFFGLNEESVVSI